MLILEILIKQAEFDSLFLSRSILGIVREIKFVNLGARQYSTILHKES